MLRPMCSVTVCYRGKLSGSSSSWFQRQSRDPYVKSAMQDSYRSRAAFKLIQIDDKHNILKPGKRVLDVGAAPGSWTQVAVERTNADASTPKTPVGKVIAVDLQPIEPIKGALMLECSDFTSMDVQKLVISKLFGHKLDIVLTDMAPNLTGSGGLDHINNVKLFIAAYGFAMHQLVTGGIFLGKLLSGSQTKKIVEIMNSHFERTKVVKPPASRKDSNEEFILGLHLKNRPKHEGGVLSPLSY